MSLRDAKQAEVKFTSSQRKVINKLAHDRAKHLYPLASYDFGFKYSKKYFSFIYTHLLIAGHKFDEIAEILTDNRLEEAKANAKAWNEKKEMLLAIEARHPFSSSR